MKKSFLQRVAGGIAKRAAKFAGIPLRDPALVAMLGRTPASSGIDVDEAKALNFSAVWCAVNLISGTVASLPINVYKRSGKGFEEVLNHPIARLLQLAPNVEMTPFIFFETLQAHMLTYGNCYAKIERDTDGNIVNLWPVMPNQIEPNYAMSFMPIMRVNRMKPFFPKTCFTCLGLASMESGAMA